MRQCLSFFLCRGRGGVGEKDYKSRRLSVAFCVSLLAIVGEERRVEAVT